MGGDAEANIAYYCLHELHLLPSQLFALDRQERAFLIAAIELRTEREEEERRELERSRAASRAGKRRTR